MSNKPELQFRISSALKNLIGKELITDCYVAVFELVKNAFDAHATKVTILFENVYKGKTKITIKDNGKGMNYIDLRNKWLFVAYSAKINGTEDIPSNGRLDYRDKIYSKRIFAGAKGVGRFSCDRLGKNLNLITIKDEKNAKIENLFTNWEKFEKDQEKEFINIDVIHKTLKQHDYLDITHGTILEITGVRDKWDRKKLLKLKHSLEKLINPNQENDVRNFAIEIIAKEEKLNDRETDEVRNKVNGLVKNFLFETLELKTTQILIEVNHKGNLIHSRLIDRGKLVYQLKEKNPYTLLRDIKIHLFQLNRAAKWNFTKSMGVEAVKYGSVFLFKNGFRVYPFGENNEDILGIDRRKAQGWARYLGTRDLIGRIEINGPNPDLKETTSRDGGLIKNPTYDQLLELFYSHALKRLERYVVRLIRWGDPYKERDTKQAHPALEPRDIKNKILSVISTLAKSEDILDIDYDPEFLDIIEERQEDSLTQNISNIAKIAEKTNDPVLYKKAKQVERQLIEIYKAMVEAETEVDKEKKDKEALQKELEDKIGENFFLKSVMSIDFEQVINLHHIIGISANTVQNHLLYIDRKIKKGKLISNNELKDLIGKITFENRKILSISNFASKANFKLEGQTIHEDLISFIGQYIINVYKDIIGEKPKINIQINSKSPFKLKFKPIEITIIIDNLIHNSKKAFAKNIFIIIDKITQKELSIKFRDDGKGLTKQIINKNDIFKMGFTTTSGSGLGLYHIVQILKEINGTIKVNTTLDRGIEFNIRIKK